MSKSEDQLVFVYSTVENEDQAATLAHALVEQRLAACVNIVPGVRSVYEWRGTLEDTGECALFIKTRRARLDAVLETARSLHPYEVPALVVLPLERANSDYRDWVIAQTNPPADKPGLGKQP